MKPIAMLGVVLIVLGIGGLFFSRVTWTETKPVAEAGPAAGQFPGRPYRLDSHRRRRVAVLAGAVGSWCIRGQASAA